MGVIYDAATRTSRMTAVRDAIDAGVAAGKLEILDAGNVLLAELTLSDPCGTVSGDVLTFSAITSDTSANANGTASKAQIKDSAAVVRVSGLTVGTSGANINLNSVAISAGQQVSITSASVTHNTSGV